MKAKWTRLAAILLVAVVCVDLVGVDCARRSAGGTSTAAYGDAACADSPDCFCCSVADQAARILPGGEVGPTGSACCAAPAAPVDGVRPVPYRPPLCPFPPSVR